jgi:FtsZ-binding cell division protein ZapB
VSTILGFQVKSSSDENHDQAREVTGLKDTNASLHRQLADLTEQNQTLKTEVESLRGQGSTTGSTGQATPGTSATDSGKLIKAGRATLVAGDSLNLTTAAAGTNVGGPNTLQFSGSGGDEQTAGLLGGK